MSRKPIGKRTRFAVFKRDLFKCQYCGATPPSAVLEIDHIDPVSLGGGNEEGNLVTSCYACNRGKAAIPLSVVPEGLAERAARVAEAEEQLAGYRAIMRAQEDRKDDDSWEVVELLTGKLEINREYRLSILKFLERLSLEEVRYAAKLTRARMCTFSESRQFKYFCGVCWKMIKGEFDE